MKSEMMPSTWTLQIVKKGVVDPSNCTVFLASLMRRRALQVVKAVEDSKLNKFLKISRTGFTRCSYNVAILCHEPAVTAPVVEA